MGTCLGNNRLPDPGAVDRGSEPGHGTSIKIYLPQFEGAVDAPKRMETNKLARGVGSELVLVVEDDNHVLALTAQMLRDLGYGVIEARGGAEALSALSKHPEIRLLFQTLLCRIWTAGIWPKKRRNIRRN